MFPSVVDIVLFNMFACLVATADCTGVKRHMPRIQVDIAIPWGLVKIVNVICRVFVLHPQCFPLKYSAICHPIAFKIPSSSSLTLTPSVGIG